MPDPDPEIRGGGGSLQTKVVRPFGSQFGLKIRGGAPSLGSTTARGSLIAPGSPRVGSYW